MKRTLGRFAEKEKRAVERSTGLPWTQERQTTSQSGILKILSQIYDATYFKGCLLP